MASASRTSACKGLTSNRDVTQTANQLQIDVGPACGWLAINGYNFLACNQTGLRCQAAILDRTGLYLQLAALRDQVVALAAIAPEYQLTEPASEGRASTDTENRLSQWWEQISRYFRIDFNPDDAPAPSPRRKPSAAALAG